MAPSKTEVTTIKVDINKVPYDAPLTMTPPAPSWVTKQTRKGTLGKNLSVPDVDLRGKWVVITGSNNGIGREAALAMARMGANIVLGCRDPPPHETHPNEVVKECEEMARNAGHEKSSFEWWEVNMADLKTVEAFGKKWLDSGRVLDILCNNAGMGSSPGESETFKTKDGFEIVHQVNFLSHVLLTLTVLPSIMKAKTPRIVCTTSCFHYPGIFDLTNFNGEHPKSGGPGGVQFYQNNKLYFQIWLTELQRRLLQHSETRHITVNGVHPGYVASGIWNLNSTSFMNWKQGILKTLAYWWAINPQQGSLAILNAAVSPDCGPDKKLQGVGDDAGKGGGRYFNRIFEEEPMPHCKDADCRCRVWRKVNDELHLQDKGLLDLLGLEYVE